MSKPAGLYVVKVWRDPDERDLWRADLRVRLDEDGAGFAVRGVSDDSPTEALDRAADRASAIIDSEPTAAATTPPEIRNGIAAIRIICRVVRDGEAADLRQSLNLPAPFDELTTKLEGLRAGKSAMMGNALCLTDSNLRGSTSDDDGNAALDALGGAFKLALKAIHDNPDVAKVVSAVVPGGPIALAAANAAQDAIDKGAKPKDVKKATEKALKDHPDKKKIADDATKETPPAWLALIPLLAGGGAMGYEWGEYGTYGDPVRDRFFGDWQASQMDHFRRASQRHLMGASDPKTRRKVWNVEQVQTPHHSPLDQGLQLDPTGQFYQRTPAAPPPGTDGGSPWDAWGGPQYGPYAPQPTYQPYGYGGVDYTDAGWPMPAPYGYGYATAGAGDAIDASDESWAYEVQQAAQAPEAEYYPAQSPLDVQAEYAPQQWMTPQYMPQPMPYYQPGPPLPYYPQPYGGAPPWGGMPPWGAGPSPYGGDPTDPNAPGGASTPSTPPPGSSTRPPPTRKFTPGAWVMPPPGGGHGPEGTSPGSQPGIVRRHG